MKKGLLFVVVVVAVCGCSSSSDPDLDAWTQEVKAISVAQIGDRQFEEIAQLEELERVISGSTKENAISAAKYRLRRRAAELDADAVVIVACDTNVQPIEVATRDQVAPPHEPVVVCHAVAIRWVDY